MTPEKCDPGEKQGRVGVQIMGRAEGEDLVCGSMGEVPNCCSAMAVEEKGNKKCVDLPGVI